VGHICEGASKWAELKVGFAKYAVLGGTDLIRLAYNDSVLPSMVDPSCLRCCMRRVGREMLHKQRGRFENLGLIAD
jgi:hypothetical protein